MPDILYTQFRIAQKALKTLPKRPYDRCSGFEGKLQSMSLRQSSQMNALGNTITSGFNAGLRQGMAVEGRKAKKQASWLLATCEFTLTFSSKFPAAKSTYRYMIFSFNN